MSRRSLGRVISITATLGARLSVPVSTNCRTHPIHDPPAGDNPTSHIAPVLIPPISGQSRRWLAHLAAEGALDPTAGPADRVTLAAIRRYLAMLDPACSSI